jgi:hypothetical protein
MSALIRLRSPFGSGEVRCHLDHGIATVEIKESPFADPGRGHQRGELGTLLETRLETQRVRAAARRRVKSLDKMPIEHRGQLAIEGRVGPGQP